MSSDFAISIRNVSKGFRSYERSQDRLKQSIYALAAMLAPSARLKSFFATKAQASAKIFWALHDIDINIRKGETIGIIGRNGSGKSTLLQIVCGTLSPTSGVIESKGRIAALLELGSGFNMEFTGRENVFMNAQLHGLTREQVEARFESIVAFADIGDFVDQPVKTYSSGMFVRLAFAVIAHVDADVLVVDEALAVGDAFFTQKCMRFLRKFMETGTVVFVSHDTSAVRSLCTRAVWIEKGHVLEDGAQKDVCNHYLEAFFEAQQGKSTTTRLRPKRTVEIKQAHKDARLAFLNSTNLRNDIRVFDFDASADSFGTGGARVVGVELFDESNDKLLWAVGGEFVTLRITVQVDEPLDSPIVGFYLKDRLGQTLFGDNTYVSHRDDPVFCDAGSVLVADFEFFMPVLPLGDYSINAAVANGNQETHTQLHWIHDALTFRSESSSVEKGLVGIPMQKVELSVLDDEVAGQAGVESIAVNR